MITGLSCINRFSIKPHIGYSQLISSIKPTNSANIFLLGQAPIRHSGSKHKKNLDITELTDEVMNSENLGCQADTSNGLFKSSAVIYRGDF
jgi:hypothetical protein